MDIWEANKISNAVTPHSCTPGNSACTSDETCGSGDGNRYKGYCDRDGCDFNPYRMGNQSFYGPGKTVDTTKPLTVVTQFVTSDNTANGDLVEIRRKYVQGGKIWDQPTSNIAGVSGNAVTDTFCKNQKSVFGDTDDFTKKGGLKAMGQAFEDGMVLVMSLWDDYDVNMHWLNSPYPTDADPSKPGVARGDCSITSGKPGDVESKYPGATVTFSNVRSGPLGSTFSGAQQPGGPGSGSGSSSSSSSVRTSTTTSRATTTSVRTTTTTTSSRTTTTSAAGGVVQKYGQCGVSVPDLSDFHASPCMLTRVLGRQLQWSYYLCERHYLRQGQRLLLAVLVDAWRGHRKDVGTMTDTQARLEKVVATIWKTLIVTFVTRQCELPHVCRSSCFYTDFSWRACVT